MAAIVETLLNDRRIVLAAEEIIRPIPWGNNWNQMRIGIRFALYGAHFGSIPTVFGFTLYGGLTFCVCNGPQGWYTDRPKDVIGLKFPISTTTMTNTVYTTSPPYYTAGNTSCGAIRKGPAGVLQNATITPQATLISSAPHLVRNIMMVTITKAATPTIALHSPTTAGQVQADVTRPLFLYAMGATTPSTTYVTNPAAGNLTYTGGDLTFDHVAVGWSKYVPGIEITDIAVSRFS